MSDALTIAGKTYSSRLLVGSGKYASFAQNADAAEARIVTVAIRRVNLGQNAAAPNLLDFIRPDRYTLLPNTAGCYTAEDAIRTCRLARELLDGHNLVKLEVLADPKTLYPDITATSVAANTSPSHHKATAPSLTPPARNRARSHRLKRQRNRRRTSKGSRIATGPTPASA